MHTIIRLRQTCTACPSQWEGATDKGEYVYIRYRWGILSVSVAGNPIFARRLGDVYGGPLTEDELIAATKNVLAFNHVR